MKRSVATEIFSLVVLFSSADFLMAGGIVQVKVNASFVSEPTWHNYGSTYTDPQGKVQQLNMWMPFFHTVSISTTVLLDLGEADVVAAKMQAKRVNGNTDLMVAATAGDLDTVKKLLNKGAMVNTKNTFGSTALMGAAAGGYEETARLLIARGAAVNQKNSRGFTALMLAAKGGHEAMVKLLLDNKADVNLADNDRHTALMYAINGEHDNVVKLLVEKGARTDYMDRLGFTPVALAAYKDNRRIISLLGGTAASAAK